MRKIEILAPAGSYESMRAAMNAGCDAVYMGGSRFGARAYANNPDECGLLRAIEEAHLRNKRLYLTVNTMIKEEERKSLLYDYLEKYYLAGLDAVIVQDVGVMTFIHRHFPKLPIHASTQTTIMMAEGADLLKDVGVTRLVAARELSFREIKNISDKTNMEIEAFVHGALCYCYSGQCLMSSMIGGRSGNRGRCAQPCRMPYRFFSEGRQISAKDEAYLLSPKDINTVALIPDLIEAGVSSFKIEGRMKSPEYAAYVTSIYRKYLDLYLTEGKETFLDHLDRDDYKKDMLNLMDLYNRGGFSQGYGKTHNGKAMMSVSRPNHSGVYVGKVSGASKGYADILLSEDINAQDILEIRDRENRPIYEFTVKDDTKSNNILRTRVGVIPYKNEHKNKASSDRADIRTGDMVYRTRNNDLLEGIADKYINKDARYAIKGYLYARIGERLQLKLIYNNKSVTLYHNIVEAAIKQPMTCEKLAASIDKLGDTLFYFSELIIEADDNIFVPVAWLNEIRRDAVTLLSKAIIASYHRRKEDLGQGAIDVNMIDDGIVTDSIIYDSISDDYIIDKDTDCECKKQSKSTISVGITTSEQFKVVLSYPEISKIYVDYEEFPPDEITWMAKKASDTGKACYILLPHICRLQVYEKLKKDIASLMNYDEIKGFVIKNFEEARLILSIFEENKRYKELILNHNMYVFNKDAKAFWKHKGIHHFTAPIELNEGELKALDLSDCELMVYGYLPLMVSVQCLHATTDSCNKCRARSDKEDYLLDRIGKKFYVKNYCSSCYNIIYNGHRLFLLSQADKVINLKPEGIRLDFTHETYDEAQAVLSAYCDVFIHGKKVSLEFDDITSGHFKRGVE